MADVPGELEIQMSADSLYQEEVFTDRAVGTIQRLTPVTEDGQRDASRPVLFIGQAQLMTRMGPLPLSFELEAGDLSEAVGKFADGANLAVEDAVKKLEEMRREQASSIIVPGSEPGVPGAGAPGGGLKMP